MNLELSFNGPQKSFIRYMVDLVKLVGTCRLYNSFSFNARMLGTFNHDFILLNMGFMHLVAWLFSESRGNSPINVSSFP